MLKEILKAIESWPISETIAESGWMFPTIETLHVIGVVTVVGTISMVDLRLLGWASVNRSVRELSDELLPYTWGAFALALLSGGLMFISKANSYFNNVPFRIKLCLLALAGLNMLVFHVVTYRRVSAWDRTLPPPPPARVAGGLSLGFWILVVFFGRWIAFVE
jgi:hypothetical protein